MTCQKRKDFVYNKLVDVATNSVSFVVATGKINHSAPAKMVVVLVLVYLDFLDNNGDDLLIFVFIVKILD
jgi:hypothetical protein